MEDKPKKKKVNGRNKGNSYERALALKFQEEGYTECVTSRSESKRTDDKGIDLCYTGGWQIQAKAVEKLSPSVHQVLKNMPDGDNLVFWKKNRLGTVVCMPEELFFKMMKVYDEHKN